jgi:hypothetical protein
VNPTPFRDSACLVVLPPSRLKKCCESFGGTSQSGIPVVLMCPLDLGGHQALELAGHAGSVLSLSLAERSSPTHLQAQFTGTDNLDRASMPEAQHEGARVDLIVCRVGLTGLRRAAGWLSRVLVVADAGFPSERMLRVPVGRVVD